MQYTDEVVSYWELKEKLWSGALDTLEDIENADKEDEVIDMLESVFFDKTPSITEINDFLWHEREVVYDYLGLDENGELPQEDED